MGRPSKGQRAAFTVRLDAPTLARVDEYAALSSPALDRVSAVAELIGHGLDRCEERGAIKARPSTPAAPTPGRAFRPDRARRVIGFDAVTGAPIMGKA
jgi:hypothetical protein